MTSQFVPIRVIELDLQQPLFNLDAALPGNADVLTPFLILVRLHGTPLGTIQVHPSEPVVSANALAKTIQAELGQVIAEHLQADGLPVVSPLGPGGLSVGKTPPCIAHQEALLQDAPLASIIIATRDRTAHLATTLDSILAQDYPQFEVIVVDNAPSNDETRRMVQTRYERLHPVRYIREDRPGLANAHNAGIVHANGTILAFADDDLRIDKRWLSCLVAAFRSTSEVGCVTGLIMPAELETRAQMWLERYGRFGKGLTSQVFDMNEHRPDNPLYPYAAGLFGSGANMAFSRETLEAIGGFDTAMGIGTSSRGGDDLAAFLDTILAGFRVVYAPTAIVWHQHRREYESLRQQVLGYGIGLSAYLTRALIHYPEHAINMLGKLLPGARHMFGAASSKNIGKPADFPKELDILERIGLLCGPFAYLKSRWETRAWSNLETYRIGKTPNAHQTE
jgi:GT2 family glycosyltransferase